MIPLDPLVVALNRPGQPSPHESDSLLYATWRLVWYGEDVAAGIAHALTHREVLEAAWQQGWDHTLTRVMATHELPGEAFRRLDASIRANPCYRRHRSFPCRACADVVRTTYPTLSSVLLRWAVASGARPGR